MPDGYDCRMAAMPCPAWNLAQCELYTLWISRCIAAATEQIPRSIKNYVTEVRAGSQQRGSVKDDGYKYEKCDLLPSGQ
ncbi:biopolymer transport exbB [Kosakonia radicincitans YD4]|nr:biopolymer transport exbB [Kosakonia radicincitans YD4]